MRYITIYADKAMATIKKEQIMAQAITLLEHNYSYGVISKKLGCPRSWISKLANR